MSTSFIKPPNWNELVDRKNELNGELTTLYWDVKNFYDSLKELKLLNTDYAVISKSAFNQRFKKIEKEIANIKKKNCKFKEKINKEKDKISALTNNKNLTGKDRKLKCEIEKKILGIIDEQNRAIIDFRELTESPCLIYFKDNEISDSEILPALKKITAQKIEDAIKGKDRTTRSKASTSKASTSTIIPDEISDLPDEIENLTERFNDSLAEIVQSTEDEDFNESIYEPQDLKLLKPNFVSTTSRSRITTYRSLCSALGQVLTFWTTLFA